MSSTDRAWTLVEQVCDPEIPTVSVVDLGIVRDIIVNESGTGVSAIITPTYSGCPAMELIEREIGAALQREFADVEVRTTLSPAWTTEWITSRGHERLRDAGIAPPSHSERVANPIALVNASPSPACPRCDSADVERISRFGSTACKALWRCRTCREPFDQFKPL